MDPKLTNLIQEAFNDAFDAGEIDAIVVVPMNGGQVETVRERAVSQGLTFLGKVKWLFTGRV